MPFYTYILRSLKENKFYYGHTSDLNIRLHNHNKGKVRSTKSRIPFEIFYFEEFETKSAAYRQEMFFKSVQGKLYLKEKGVF